MATRLDLRITGEISVLRLAPLDFVVIRVDVEHLEEHIADEIRVRAQEVFPDNQVLVLSKPLSLEVLRPEVE